MDAPDFMKLIADEKSQISTSTMTVASVPYIH